MIQIPTLAPKHQIDVDLKSFIQDSKEQKGQLKETALYKFVSDLEYFFQKSQLIPHSIQSEIILKAWDLAPKHLAVAQEHMDNNYMLCCRYILGRSI